MGRLAGKIAIITGAAKGLGEADARMFAREGATVIMTDVDRARRCGNWPLKLAARPSSITTMSVTMPNGRH